MGICDSKESPKPKKRLDTFEDLDPPKRPDSQKTAAPPAAGETLASTEETQTETVHKKVISAENKIPSEKLSLIDQRDILTSAVRETNFFQNQVDDSTIEKLYSQSEDGKFSSETLAHMLEQYVIICANFAKKEIQYQKEKLKKVRRENNLDKPNKLASPSMDEPVISRQSTGAMFGRGEKQGLNKEEADALFSREIEQMKNELASDLASMEDGEMDEELDDDAFLEITEPGMNPMDSDFMPTRDDAMIASLGRKSLGDANLQRKCGETIVTCNSFISKLNKDPDLMLAGVPRKFGRKSFSNFLPNFLESYAKELGVFEVELMSATRSSDGGWKNAPATPLSMGEVPVSVFILSMTCYDVDLPWDPVDYKIGESQSVRQMIEFLFSEYPGLNAYKDKFRITLVQKGKVIEIPNWFSDQILLENDELTINF